MNLNPLAIHLHLRILLNLIIVKLPDSLREQLKIPLGILLPIGQDNKENIQKHTCQTIPILLPLEIKLLKK